MKASELIEELTALMDRNQGEDLDVTVIHGPYEYSVQNVGYAPAGPLQIVGENQGQNPPNRFTLETKDNLS